MTTRMQRSRRLKRLWLLICLVWVVLSSMVIVTAQENDSQGDSDDPVKLRHGQVIADMENDYYLRCVGESLQRVGTHSTSEALQHLSKTKCEKCQLGRAHANSGDDEGPLFHAMVLLTEEIPQMIPLVTALLGTNQFKVTLLRLHFEEDQPEGPSEGDTITAFDDEGFKAIHQEVMAGIPCGHPTRSRKDALTVVDAALPNLTKLTGIPCRYPSTVYPLDFCSVEAGAPTVHLMERIIRFAVTSNTNVLSQLPDVFIMDASLIGGLWVSEACKIPTVAIANHNFLPLAVEHDPDWRTVGGSIWGRLWKVFQQRLYSLSLTGKFLHMNKSRQQLHLPPLLSPMHYFKPVVAIIMDFIPPKSLPPDPSSWLGDVLDDYYDLTASGLVSEEDSQQQQWKNLHVLNGSLQSPCILCNPSGRHYLGNKLHDTKKLPPTIIFVPPPSVIPEWSRSLLQGLILARESLHKYDDCEWLSMSCQKPFSNFQVIWMTPASMQDDYFPPFVPDYVHRETSLGLLDTLSRYPETIAAVLPCDTDAALLENDFDIPVICIESDDRLPLRADQTPPPPLEPRVLAAQLLKLLRTRQQKQESISNPSGPSSAPSSSTERSSDDSSNSHDTKQSASFSTSHDAMVRSLSIIYKAAQIQKARVVEGVPWESIDEMRDTVVASIGDHVDLLSNQYPANSQRSIGSSGGPSERPHFDNLTVLVAWLVVLASAFYILALDRSWVKPARRSHHYHYHSGNHNHTLSTSTITEGLWSRTRDLEDSWVLWSEWYRSQSYPFQDFVPDLTSRSGRQLSPGTNAATAVASPAHGATGGNRRRKKR